MPNKNGIPFLKVVDIPRRTLGEGFGVYRFRHYDKITKKYKDTEKRYGGRYSKDVAYEKIMKAREEFLARYNT